MKINIINLDRDGWILTKFAKKMNFQFNEMGHTSYLAKSPKTNVDVNHSIIFLFLQKDKSFFPSNTINTTMLTHVNDDFRYNKIKSIANYLNAGIAMSKDHSHFIRNKKLGLKKIFHVLPPHDNDLSIKKVHFGIFTNLYSDGRKHESFFFETINKLDPQLVKFSIIGKGWKQIVKKLERNNFEINYQRFFFRKRYISELTKIDYLIYLGKDEGSMSFLDAIQLGIKTIMIPQGFQKDLKRFITYEVSEDLKNLDQIFEKILLKKKSYISTKQKLTWENYALEHIKIWEELKKR